MCTHQEQICSQQKQFSVRLLLPCSAPLQQPEELQASLDISPRLAGSPGFRSGFQGLEGAVLPPGQLPPDPTPQFADQDMGLGDCPHLHQVFLSSAP